MQELMDFINPNLFILIPVINFIGIGLKKNDKLKNYYIPIYLGLISIVLSGLNIFSSLPAFTLHVILTALFSSITQGILIAAVSVYAHQLYSQYCHSCQKTNLSNDDTKSNDTL